MWPFKKLFSSAPPEIITAANWEPQYYVEQRGFQNLGIPGGSVRIGGKKVSEHQPWDVVSWGDMDAATCGHRTLEALMGLFALRHPACPKHFWCKPDHLRLVAQCYTAYAHQDARKRIYVDAATCGHRTLEALMGLFALRHPACPKHFWCKPDHLRLVAQCYTAYAHQDARKRIYVGVYTWPVLDLNPTTIRLGWDGRAGSRCGERRRTANEDTIIPHARWVDPGDLRVHKDDCQRWFIWRLGRHRLGYGRDSVLRVPARRRRADIYRSILGDGSGPAALLPDRA